MVTSLLQHPETRYFGFYSVALPAEFTPAGMVMFIQGFRDDHGGNKTAILPSISAVLDTT